jgi:hypothetical protein
MGRQVPEKWDWNPAIQWKKRLKSGSISGCFTKDGLGNDEYMVYIW